jgi:hypothetical protein
MERTPCPSCCLASYARRELPGGLDIQGVSRIWLVGVQEVRELRQQNDRSIILAFSTLDVAASLSHSTISVFLSSATPICVIGVP